ELEYGRGDLNPCTRGQAGAADIESNVQLVPGERPALAITRHRRRCSCVHERQLGIWIWTAIGRPAAPTNEPGVALETIADVEPSLGQDFPFVHGGAPRDQLESPAVHGRRLDVIETLL